MTDSDQDPNRPNVQQQAKLSKEVLIEHAHRLWLSECENATRIAHRYQLLAGGILAMLGLGLFNFSWRYDQTTSPVFSTCLAWAIHLLLFIAILCFAWALLLMYGITSAKHGTSTEVMEITDEDIDNPIRELVFTKVYNAYLDLKSRNRFHWNKLKKAQKWFSCGVALVFVVVTLYHWGGINARIGQGIHHGHTSTDNSKRNRNDQFNGAGPPSSSEDGTKPPRSEKPAT